MTNIIKINCASCRTFTNDYEFNVKTNKQYKTCNRCRKRYTTFKIIKDATKYLDNENIKDEIQAKIELKLIPLIIEKVQAQIYKDIDKRIKQQLSETMPETIKIELQKNKYKKVK